MNKQTIPASDEAWDEGTLGADEDFVKVASEDLTAEIDAAAGTQMISIRLQKSLIDDLKTIAALRDGIGYQTLMKQILQRFATCEKKQIWNELISEKLKERQRHPEAEAKPKARQRKVA